MNRLVIHQLVLFGFLLLVSGFRLLTGRWSLDLGVAYWWLGAMIGFVFVFFDRVVFAFWQDPQAVSSLKLKELFGQGKFGKGLATLLNEDAGQERLIIRSVLFLAVWVVMAIFAFFSVGGEFGRGFMVGLGLHLVTDLMKDFLGKGREIKNWFWQIKREIEPQEITAVVWGFVILAVLLMIGL